MRHPKALVIVAAALAILAWAAQPGFAATNQAVHDAAGGFQITDSGTVTITSSTVKLIKQVYDASGNCLASSEAVGSDSCNGGKTSVNVPAGTALKFLVYTRNDTDVQLSDVRFQDVLDTSGTGFTWVGSIKITPVATLPAQDALSSAIYTSANTGTAQTDALGAPDDYVSYVGSTLAVGAVNGQASQALNVASLKAFGALFNVTKK